MSVLSILNRLKVDAKFLIPIVFVFGLLLRSVNSVSPATSSRDDTKVNVEKLPFCDENLINDRHQSKR